MIILGWILATLGTVGTLAAVGMEIISNEPIYLLMMKLTTGTLGVGGILLAVKSLRGPR